MEDTSTQPLEANRQDTTPDTPSPVLPPEANSKKDTYGKWSIALIYTFIFSPLMSLLAFIIMPLYCIILSVMGNGERTKPVNYCIELIIFAFISAFISIAVDLFYTTAAPIMIGINNQIAEAIIQNTKEAQDKQYAIQNWCDILKTDKEFSSWWSNKKENDLVLNEYATQMITAGKTIPEDMVVMFHGTKGWNQVGSQDKLAKSCPLFRLVPVLFGDYKTKLIPRDRTNRLRWEITDTPKSLANTARTPFYIFYGILIAAGLYIFKKQRRYLLRYSVLAIIVAVFSGIAGHVFANMGLEYLYIGEPAKLANYTPIYLISAATDIAFILLLAPLIDNPADNKHLFLKIARLAGYCGLAASTLIHIYIVIYKKTLNPCGIIGGGGYGIYAGMLLGIITYWMIYLSGKLKPQYQPKQESL